MAKRDNLNDNVTPVIFRKFRDGEIIALFPYIAGDTDGYTCQSFMHVGQHATANPGKVMDQTKPATLDEARVLVVELTSSPYFYPPLRVLHRFTPHAAAERRRQVTR